MKHKNKSGILFPDEKNFFSRINFNFISKEIAPLIILLIGGIFIVFVQWAVLDRRGNSFTLGEPSPETYRVISEISYDDQTSTETLRSMVEDSVAGVVVRDVSAKSRLQRRLEALRDMTLEQAQNSPINSGFPNALLNAIIKLNPEDKARILNYSFKVGSSYIDRLESERVFRGNNYLVSSILWEEINKVVSQPDDANFIYQILSGLGSLNFQIDSDLTELAKSAAARNIPIIARRLEPGDVIVNKGEVITDQIASILRVQGYTETSFPWTQFCIAVLLVFALPLWTNILKHGAGDTKPTWWVVVFIVFSAWIAEAVAAQLGIYGAGTLAPVSIAYICVPDYLAFCLSLIASSSGVFIVTGQAFSNQIMLSALAVSVSTFGFYFLRNLESRKQVFRRILIMTFIALIIRMTLRHVTWRPFVAESFSLYAPFGRFWREALFFFMYEAIVTHVMLFILQYFEEYLDTLSVLSIREISHPSSPLLRDLQRQAPGTYQHCLTIATLIEAVGIELGMDTNLLRAGAYYHDIGKLRRPQYFVENQGGGLNLHDEMSPMLSSMTIISHVKDGLELAWEAKLPKKIRNFIAEHHGTTSTRYFYNKAVANGENVEWSAFCYPGPKPQSRETALLMIVDSVEAATRAANIREIEENDSNREQGKTLGAIEKIVNQVVNSKINEHQFDDVNFTFKDLTLIKQTLISVLKSMYHTRHVKKIEKKK